MPVGGGHGSGRPVGVHCDGRPQHRGVLVPAPARVSSGRLLHDIELGDGQAQVGLYLLQRPSQGDRAGIPFAGGLGHRCDQDPLELLGYVASPDRGDLLVEHSVEQRELVVAVCSGDIDVG